MDNISFVWASPKKCKPKEIGHTDARFFYWGDYDGSLAQEPVIDFRPCMVRNGRLYTHGGSADGYPLSDFHIIEGNDLNRQRLLLVLVHMEKNLAFWENDLESSGDGELLSKLKINHIKKQKAKIEELKKKLKV